MDVVHACCAGVDVHKRTVVACVLQAQPDGGVVRQVRTVGTMTAELLALDDWLTTRGVEHVALESTGVYWRPVYTVLEEGRTIVLVNPQHMKAVPGRKTDVKDAEWLADLLQHGLLRASFIPPAPVRALRELTRHRRTLVQERVQVANRVQKVLESANLKLASVASNVLGVSGRAMLDALVAGNDDPAALAELRSWRVAACERSGRSCAPPCRAAYNPITASSCSSSWRRSTSSTPPLPGCRRRSSGTWPPSLRWWPWHKRSLGSPTPQPWR